MVSKKCRVVEIQDRLTWTEAFTIFQMVMCTTHPHRWPDLTKYKLLIIQTAWQSPSRAWLEYDLAFRKDAAAIGGLLDSLLIDAMALEECRMRKKNLNCTRVDVAKAYNSVSHNWLIRTLELHKIPNAIKNAIVKLSRQ